MALASPSQVLMRSILYQVIITTHSAVEHEVRKICEHAKSEIQSVDSIKDNGQIAYTLVKQYKELFNNNQ